MRIPWPTSQGVVDSIVAGIILGVAVAAGSLMLTTFFGIAQSMQGVSPSWGVLSSVFVGSFIMLIGLTWLMTWLRKQENRVIPASLPEESSPVDDLWFIGAAEATAAPAGVAKGELAKPVPNEEVGRESSNLSIVLVANSHIDPNGSYFPLKLWILWENTGSDVHLGKAEWKEKAGKLHIHKDRPLPAIFYNKDNTDSDTFDLKNGESVALWIGLNPSMGFERAELLRRSRSLGILTFSVSDGRKTIQITARF